MAAHARLSPSASKRWLTCPGSVRLIEAIRHTIADDNNRYASEGTVAHKIGDLCLTGSLDPIKFLGKKYEEGGFVFTVDENMVEAVTVYTDYITDILTDAEKSDVNIEVGIEVRCDLRSLNIEGLDGGTGDCVLVCFEHCFVEVVDYKHGQGVAVEVENNTQLMLYALAIIVKLIDDLVDIDDWRIYLTIVQPRAIHSDGPIRKWSLSAIELLVWAKEILLPKAKRTHDADAEFVVSDEGCRFCQASGQCPALATKTMEVAMLDFEDDPVVLPSVETLTVEQKKFVLQHSTAISNFLSAVETQVKYELDKGSLDYLGDYKLVRRNTHRKFKESAFDAFESPLYDFFEHKDLIITKEKPLTLVESMLKKVVGKKQALQIMGQITEKPEGDLVLAPESDKRVEVQGSVISDFNNLD